MSVHTPRKADLWRAEDRRLAALAAAGDEHAFEAIFERHHRGLLSFCRHLLGSREEAEDAVQHTFAAAFRQLVQHDPPEHLRAWLYATARNRCVDLLRAPSELPADPPPTSTAGLTEEVERRSDLRELVDDIGRLPEDQRAALVLSELEELGHAEVAEVLGCPPKKVRALVFQARSSLSGWREARALPCRDVRQELAVARGAALRQRHLRRHLKVCPQCAAFRRDIDRQRRRMALVLPVLPSLGLKERVLEGASGAATGGAGAASGGAAGGGGAAGSLGPAAIKTGLAVLALGVGAATFGSQSGGDPERAPSVSPPPDRSAAVERRDNPRRPQTQQSDVSRRSPDRRPRDRTTDSRAPDQSGQQADAPDAAPSSQPAPAPAPQAPSDGGALPDTDLKAGVEVEVEVDPPDALP
jgi:RNA polymerase sigma factor (sigma-70 family)